MKRNDKVIAPNYTNYDEAVYDRYLMKGLHDQCDAMMSNAKHAVAHCIIPYEGSIQRLDYDLSFKLYDDKNKHDDKDKLGSVRFERINYDNGIQSAVFCDKNNNVLKVEHNFDKCNEYFEQMKNMCEPDQVEALNLMLNTVYTFEHKSNPNDKIGYSVAVGPLTESARVFGEFENQETIEGRDWTTCKWHKDLNAAEEYIKSRSDDYNKMLEEKRITFTKDIDTDAAMAKGWVSVEMREGYGPQNVRYMNFSNGTVNFDDPGDHVTKEVAANHGKFVKNTNLMIEAHDFAGHPDGDILYVTALEDKTIQYRDDKGKCHDIVINKGDEMYVGGETVLDKPVSDFHATLQEKIRNNAGNAKDSSDQRQNTVKKPGE